MLPRSKNYSSPAKIEIQYILDFSGHYGERKVCNFHRQSRRNYVRERLNHIPHRLMDGVLTFSDFSMVDPWMPRDTANLSFPSISKNNLTKTLERSFSLSPGSKIIVSCKHSLLLNRTCSIILLSLVIIISRRGLDWDAVVMVKSIFQKTNSLLHD